LSAGAAFDGGAEGEAKRLATVLRVLLHDRRRSASLLGQLGVKGRISFVDTAQPIHPHNLMATPGLVMMRIGADGGSYVAPLAGGMPERYRNPNKPFGPWWNEPVTKDAAGRLFSRKDYVLTVSNKEGGAHVDHTLDGAYAALTKGNSLGWVYSSGDDDDARPMERNPAFASVRQVAFEVSRTLAQHPLTLGLGSLGLSRSC